MQRITILAILLLGGAGPLVHADELWLPSIFSEKMVLQRDMPLPIWGKAAPGAKVTVALYKNNDRTQPLAEGSAAAAADGGRWRVDLKAVPVQKRCALLVTAEGPDKKRAERRLFDNVRVGEVWITCGQSNSLFPLETCADYVDALKRRCDYPLMRACAVGVRESHSVTEPQEELYSYWGLVKWNDSVWQSTRESTTDIPWGQTGLSYFFARELTDYLGKGVPVGMVNVCAILPVETWVAPAEIEARKELHHLRGKGYPNATGRGFMANIMPLAPYAARGVIYYQGEMNAGRCFDYYHGLQGVIASWRRIWKRKDMPFLVVQLPGLIGHMAKERRPSDMDAKALAAYKGGNVDHSWCYIREAQLRVSRADPRVGLAVTIDLGERFDAHPPRKRPVAERLFLQARKLVYSDKAVVADAPAPTEFARDGKSFVVTFDGVGDGLVGKDKLAGFELRDAAGAWRPAQASIEGNQVRVQVDGLAEPTGVRYAWAGFPPVTLYNSAGLPATPFSYPEVDLHKHQPK